jgi:hypothetical protein
VYTFSFSLPLLSNITTVYIHFNLNILILLVEGDVQEGRRVYAHCCTGRGAFSRGAPERDDEETIVSVCEALWLLRDGVVSVRGKLLRGNRT